MSVHAFLDLPAIYNYSPNIFQLFKLPAGIDRSTFFYNLCMECAELEIKYADPVFLRDAIGWWSKRRLRVWEDLAKTLTYEYDPIYNFDRKEEWTETTDRDLTKEDSNTHSDDTTRKLTDSHSLSDNTTVTSTGTVNTDITEDVDGSTSDSTDHTGTDTTEGTTTTTLERTAFNTDTLATAEKTTADGNSTVTYNTTDSSSGTSTTSTTGTHDETRNLKDITAKTADDDRDIDETVGVSGSFSNNGSEVEDTTLVHTGRLYGNIGVTTTQKLIQEQRELVQFDLQRFIIDDFQDEFCLLVY